MNVVVSSEWNRYLFEQQMIHASMHTAVDEEAREEWEGGNESDLAGVIQLTSRVMSVVRSTPSVDWLWNFEQEGELVISVHVWVSSGHSGFLPQSTDMRVRSRL